MLRHFVSAILRQVPISNLTVVVKDHILVQRNFESANESLVPISKDLSFVLQTFQHLPQVSEKYGEQGHIPKLYPDVAILHQFHCQPTSVQLQPCCEQQQGVSLLLMVMQVLRDHELVLSCTRNLVLVFSIVILLTTQDVSGESILSQS